MARSRRWLAIVVIAAAAIGGLAVACWQPRDLRPPYHDPAVDAPPAAPLVKPAP